VLGLSARRVTPRATRRPVSPASLDASAEFPPGAMINVAHVITDLGTGGAESMLLKLLSHTDRRRFSPRVYDLSNSVGRIRRQIETLDIPVTSLGMGRRVPNPAVVVRLGYLLRTSRIDLVQTWMYHADLVGGVAAKVAGMSVPVIWNIRQSNLDPSVNRRRTLGVVRLCAKMSSWLPDAVICCSSQARRVHVAVGYCDAKLRVIPNGFDVAAFRPDPEARAAIRATLGIPDEAPVIGMVARFDPQKDHGTFIDAASRLRARCPSVRFVLCGNRISRENSQLVEWIDAAGLTSACSLLGERNDVARVIAAVDVATLSSLGEGFPNAIGEAMACGVPCVATDVGDSAEIIGDTGLLVPPRNPGALADAWHLLLAKGGPYLDALGARARARVTERFSIDAVARSYEQLYETIAHTRAEAVR